MYQKNVDRNEALEALRETFKAKVYPKTYHHIHTEVEKLDRFLDPIKSKEAVVEWGSPYGQLGRILMALVIKSIAKTCVWIFDQKDLVIHPRAWTDLGFDLENIHFIKADRPLHDLKAVYTNSAYAAVVIDTQEYLKASDFAFLRSQSEIHHQSFFVLRPFFLSNRNGNPYTHYRLNSSFNLRSQTFQINFVKGAHQRPRPVHINLSEVFHG